MQRISICGLTASGKTTLAKKIGSVLDIPVHHLDQIFWKTGGVFAPDAEAVSKVSEIIGQPSWIIEGSMPGSKTFSLRTDAADTIVFYDLPLWLVLWRQTKRFCKYFGTTRPDMGGNCIQRYPFTAHEIVHAVRYPREKIYKALEPHTADKKIIIIKRLKDERQFLQQIVQTK